MEYQECVRLTAIGPNTNIAASLKKQMDYTVFARLLYLYLYTNKYNTKHNRKWFL